jgi:ISXO2-like transposase domain
MVCADGHASYDILKGEHFHFSLGRARGQYVVGAIHTQTIEGFLSLVKRGMVGPFHEMPAKYLPLYVAEFRYRYNNLENKDIFGAAVSAC